MIKAIRRRMSSSISPNISSNIILSESLKRLGRYANKYNVFLYKYVHGEIPSNKRILWFIFCRFCCLLVGIRFGLLVFFNNQLMRTLMTDFTYKMGNSRLTCALLACSGLIIFLIGFVIQYQEMAHTNYSYYHNMKIIELNHPAKIQFDKRLRFLSKIMNFYTKFLLRQTYRISITISYISIHILVILGYLDSHSGFSIISIIFWVIPTYIFFQQFYGIIIVGNISWLFDSFFAKYWFEDINTKIGRYLKFPNNRLLMRAIAEHNSAVKYCQDLNHLYKYLIFILYYMCSPAFMLCIYYILLKDTSFVGVLIGSCIMIVGYSSVFGVTLFSSQITTAAHKPRKVLYRKIAQKSLPLQQKLKISSFIEKLCGPDIGFNCLDFFPMNYFEFYLYITNCIPNCILFTDLFNSFN